VPACQHQRGLGLRQSLARHQNVNVIEHSPRHGGQVGSDIGRALEHDQWTVEIGQRGAKLLQFPVHRRALLVGQRFGGIEMPARCFRDCGRQPVPAKAVRQTRQQSGRACLPHQRVPLAYGKAGDGVGRAQGADEKITGHGRTQAGQALSARRSNAAMASCNWL
jgi:hypothetical protein